MYHVAIISENRILLKHVYELIEDTTMFCIHIIPFSMDAYEVFYQNHVDIVILDTAVFLPYENILEQFKQCQWNYHVLLLFEDREAGLVNLTDANLFWLSKNEFSKELFQEVFAGIQTHTDDARKENVTISIDWQGMHRMSVHPDAYYLIYLRCFESQHKITDNLRKKLLCKTDQFCKMQVIFNNSTEMLCYISRSSIKETFHIQLLAHKVFEEFGYQSSIIYEQNVNWKKVQEVLEDLKKYQKYSYFLSGQVGQLQEIKQYTSTISEKDIKKQCMQLLSALIKNDIYTADHLLQNLYLHIVKSEFKIYIREYCRVQLHFFSFFLARETLNYIYPSAEDEIDGIRKSNLFQLNDYPSAHIQELLEQVVLLIYQYFDTEISLEGIAKKLNLHKVYLNRIFKEHFGITVLEALQILKLQHAKYYLVFSDKKVAEIAELVGFSDAGYFCKFFRKKTGISALEFRMKREDEREMENRYAGFMEI